MGSDFDITVIECILNFEVIRCIELNKSILPCNQMTVSKYPVGFRLQTNPLTSTLLCLSIDNRFKRSSCCLVLQTKTVPCCVRPSD